MPLVSRFTRCIARLMFHHPGFLTHARLLPLLALVLLPFSAALAGTTLGPWVPIFKGIDHAVGTNNTPTGDYPDSDVYLQVAHVVRIDLTDPDIQFFITPRISGWSLENRETAGMTVSNFLYLNSLQVAVNANNFHDPGTADSPDYLAAEGTPFEVGGVSVCRGQVVSVQESSVDAGTFMFATNNQPTFVPTNWPAHSTAGMFTVVSGLYTILVNGVNVGSNYISFPESDARHGVQPRTAFGLSQDRHYFYLLTIDGRQSGYSDGARDWRTAAWLVLAGAWDGVNMDGGGSTTMVMADSTGRPIELNRSSAIPASGRERTVGSHLGVFAKPVPGFFTNVLALPDRQSVV